MITINTDITTAKTNNINLIKTDKQTVNLPIDKDTVSFTGTIIRPVKNENEIKEIVNLFYNSFKHNLEPNNITLPWLNKIDRYFSTMPFIAGAKSPKSITEIIKNETNLAGGYSMVVNHEKSTAHISFITLAPEFMKTKSGVSMLKSIAERICQNADINNVIELTWTTNSKNKPMNRMLQRFPMQKKWTIAGESEYKISLEDFKNTLQKISQHK